VREREKKKNEKGQKRKTIFSNWMKSFCVDWKIEKLRRVLNIM
jgi:hypothetical protein